MNDNTSTLTSLINRNMKFLSRLMTSMDQVFTDDLQKIGRTDTSALMVAGLLENYYTCLETIFFRISQFFENDLQEEQWHRDLLDKMTLDIEGVRIAAVSEANYGRLLEILKFRHFKRYYFELEYDWDRLEFLKKKLLEAHPIVEKDLNRFVEFLRSI